MQADSTLDTMPDEALTHVAHYFRALAEPTRLRILASLQDGEHSVSEIVQLTGCGQANVSKHLAVLLEAGMLTRSARGTSAIYAIADPTLRLLWDVVCKNVLRAMERESAAREALSRQVRGSAKE